MQTARRTSPPGGDSPAVYWHKISALHYESCYKMEKKLIQKKKELKQNQELIVELVATIENLQKNQRKTVFFALQ